MATPAKVVAAIQARVSEISEYDKMADVTVTSYPEANCSGIGVNTTIYYEIMYQVPTMSYILSRGLDNIGNDPNNNVTEQLDFSDFAAGQGSVDGLAPSCSHFLEMTNPDSNNNALSGQERYELTNGVEAHVSRLMEEKKKETVTDS